MTNFTFDGTQVEISQTEGGFEVRVTEGGHSLELVTENGQDLFANAAENGRAMVRAGMDAWAADRIAYCFHLAARRMAAA